MKGKWEVERIETGSTALGIPDLLFHINRTGFIELKVIKAWPKRFKTIVKVDRFTEDQKYQLNRWDNTFLFLKVEKKNTTCYSMNLKR